MIAGKFWEGGAGSVYVHAYVCVSMEAGRDGGAEAASGGGNSRAAGADPRVAGDRGGDEYFSSRWRIRARGRDEICGQGGAGRVRRASGASEAGELVDAAD